MTVGTRYRLEGTIGLGPDGPVHRAVAERLGARPVALRGAVVPAGPARDELRRRAEAIAMLGCPSLAVVDDIVEVDDQRVRLAGTLGPHGTLADRLVLGPLDVRAVVAVVRPLVEALAAAHGAGLVHGHLSPTNIVFADHGPVVTDLALLPGPHASVADDVAALAALATSLVDAIDPIDPSPAVAAYRSLWARVAADPTVALADLAGALARLPTTAPPAPSPPSVPVPAARATAAPTAAVVAAAVGAAAGVGLAIGAVATWLPALAG